MREKIPQTLLASPDRNFKVEFAIRGVAGVRLSDALSEFAELDDGESRPFTNNGSRQIRLVIKVSVAIRCLHNDSSEPSLVAGL